METLLEWLTRREFENKKTLESNPRWLSSSKLEQEKIIPRIHDTREETFKIQKRIESEGMKKRLQNTIGNYFALRSKDRMELVFFVGTLYHSKFSTTTTSTLDEKKRRKKKENSSFHAVFSRCYSDFLLLLSACDSSGRSAVTSSCQKYNKTREKRIHRQQGLKMITKRLQFYSSWDLILETFWFSSQQNLLKSHSCSHSDIMLWTQN